MLLIEAVADEQQLLRCFGAVRPTNDSPEGYRRAYAAIELRLAAFIRETSEQLKQGTFRFQPPRYVDFKGKRPLLVIGPGDRAVERSILAALGPQLRDVLAFSGTYARQARQGEEKRSLQHLAQSVVGHRREHPYAFETDIKKFFPSIRHEILHAALNEVVSDSSINQLLTQIVERRPPEGTPVKQDYLWYFEELQRGVPQGSCLSPILASVYLASFDKALETNGHTYVRYVDDLIVFCSCEEAAREVEAFVHSELSHLYLNAHRSDVEEDDKAAIVGPEHPVTFVGFEFSPPDVIRPRSKAVTRFEERITEIACEANDLRSLLVQTVNFVEGWIAAYSQCRMPITLRRRLDEHQLRTVRKWLEQRKALAKSYHNYPKRSQATDLGLVLLDKSRGHVSPLDFKDDRDWYEGSLEEPVEAVAVD